MSSIDRLDARDTVRTSVRRTDVARSGGAHPQPDLQQSTTVDLAMRSDWARRLAASLDTVRNASDVREDRVAEIRQHLSDGTYNVPARLLARKMLNPGRNRS